MTKICVRIIGTAAILCVVSTSSAFAQETVSEVSTTATASASASPSAEATSSPSAEPDPESTESAQPDDVQPFTFELDINELTRGTLSDWLYKNELQLPEGARERIEQELSSIDFDSLELDGFELGSDGLYAEDSNGEYIFEFGADGLYVMTPNQEIEFDAENLRIDGETVSPDDIVPTPDVSDKAEASASPSEKPTVASSSDPSVEPTDTPTDTASSSAEPQQETERSADERREAFEKRAEERRQEAEARREARASERPTSTPEPSESASAEAVAEEGEGFGGWLRGVGDWVTFWDN